MNKKTTTSILCALLLTLSAVTAFAIPTYNGFTTRNTGDIITANIWNGEFSDFISHVNANVIATLNKLANKGELLTSDGDGNIEALTNNGAADDGKFLKLNSSAPLGFEWDTPPNQIIENQDCCLRVSISSGFPYSNGATVTKIYANPCNGNTVDLYESSQWKKHTFTPIEIDLAGRPANTNYDVFVYDSDANETVDAAELVAWTNNTTRSAELGTQDGVFVKSGTPARRYVATIRTTSAGGATTDTPAQRFIWNYYNRQQKNLAVGLANDSYTYSGTSWRVIGGNAGAVIELVVGVREDILWVDHMAEVSGNADNVSVGIGVGTTSSNDALFYETRRDAPTAMVQALHAYWFDYLSAGYRTIYPVERSGNGDTATFYGDDGDSGHLQTGLRAIFRM